jgi:lipopolysaccharide/colanic/teichoic acid biosynthesis glycosyltransferase
MNRSHRQESANSSQRRQRRLKRLLDLALTLPLLFLSLPFMAVVAVGIAMTMGCPVVFTQPRPGFKGRRFDFLKFRTMRSDVGPDGALLPDEERLTWFGNLLRKTSLDELPQLFNVLAGELSLVGPRPLLMEYLPRYSPEQMRRHDVPPGITGWAQVNGRNSISWTEKFALDVWYVDHWSLSLDVLILFRTLAAVVKRTGISHQGSVTMPKFMGNSPEVRS